MEEGGNYGKFFSIPVNPFLNECLLSARGKGESNS